MIRLIVELEIEGDEKNAYAVVDDILDGGVFQDAINDHDGDAGPLRVKSAVVRLDDRKGRRR